MKFQKVSKFKDVDLPLPVRATARSAGYDFIVAEDTIVPSAIGRWQEYLSQDVWNQVDYMTLDTMSAFTRATGIKPTLVSTGMKCYLNDGYYLELSVRSSTPLKNWLFLANGVGIIDADYVDNADNEGEIFFQLINLSPWPILLKKGDKIGQGIIKKYYIASDDEAKGIRSGGFGSTSGLMQNAIDLGDFKSNNGGYDLKAMHERFYQSFIPKTHE